MSVEDLKVLVTGGGSGIGAATCSHLAARGAAVAVVDVAEEADRVAEAIRASGGTAESFRADVTVSSEVEAMVEGVVRRFGRIDGAFNNAGVEQAHLPLHELSSEQWNRVIDVDLTGVFHCLKHEVTAMLESGGGAIVNTASVLGSVAIADGCEYVTAKHGVIGLTRAAAVEYASRGIRVNAVLPGVVNTPMIERALQDPGWAEKAEPLRVRHATGRFAEMVEIAEAVEWLLSGSSSFVTGASLAVDGGFLAN